MLPRKSSLCRVLLGVTIVFLLLYTLLSPSKDNPNDFIHHVSELDNPPGHPGRMLQPLNVNTEKTPVLNDTAKHVVSSRPATVFIKKDLDPEDGVQESHRHDLSNHTLEEMRKNMTLLKVNMSGLAAIVHQANKSNSLEFYNYGNSVPHPHPFKYLINAPGMCLNKDIFLIVYIHTAPDHYKRRMIIRNTWGNPAHYDVTVRLVFVMGYTPNKPELQQALAFEAEQYGDMVQEDFIDSYKNLTYKGVAALKWISVYCSHAKFVLKTDDDIFVNTFTLLRHLVSLDKHGMENKGLLMCLVWYHMKVMRTGKWKVDESEWKDGYYPTYCSGSAFTMSTDVAVALHNISYFVPFFWVDDFYITGLLPLKLGTIKHKQFMSTYVLDGRKLEEKFTGPQWFTYIFSHVHDLNAIQSVWRKLLHLSQGETTATVKYALPGELQKLAEAQRKKEEEAQKAKQQAKKQ